MSERNYNRVCAECESGQKCSQPYEALDGTIYECGRKRGVAMTTDNRTICTEKCWTAVACPDHGDRMYPFGRSAGIEAYYCCDNYADPTLNPRHLWSEHDSTRWYTDPEGWNAHEASCKECKGDDDD